MLSLATEAGVNPESDLDEIPQGLTSVIHLLLQKGSTVKVQGSISSQSTFRLELALKSRKSEVVCKSFPLT